MPIRRVGAAVAAVVLALLLIVGLCTSAVSPPFRFDATAVAAPAHHIGDHHGRVGNRHGGVGLTLVPLGWTTTSATLTSGGIDRSYLVIRPPADVTGPLPVVLVLPGRDLAPTGIERITRLIPIIGNAIMVYPAGVDLSWNAGACCGVAHARGIDDVAFLDALIRHVLATQPGASSREVYLVGFSNGGRMAYRMACQSPNLVDGFAAVEAVPVYACPKLDPIPVVIIAQSGDPLLTVPANGRPKTIEGYVEPTVDATVQRWLRLDGCGTDGSVTTIGSARVATYDRCGGRGRLEYVLYPGGRHDWPHGDASTPSAGELIWAFFHHGGRPVLAGQGRHHGPTKLA